MSLLKENSSLFSSFILKSIRDCIVVTDISDKVVKVNEPFLARYKYREDEVLDSHISFLWDGIDKKGNSKKKLPKEIKGVWIYNRPKSGDKFPVFLSRSIILDDKNRALGTLVILREVSELSRAKDAIKEVENRFKQLSETIDQAFWLSNESRTVFTYLSPQFGSFWGVKLDSIYKDSEVFYKTIYKEDRERIRSLAPNLKKGGYDEEFRIVKEDKTIRWMRERAYPVFDDFKNVVGVSGVIDDITEEKEVKRKNDAIQEGLLHSQKLEAMGRLAGGIAHDFNNILGAIIGYAEMTFEDLKEGSLESHNVKEILIASNRAKKLVSQILTFSRKKITKYEELNIVNLINESTNLIKATIPSTVEIRISIENDNVFVLGDSDKLQNVLINIFTNAFYAMKGVDRGVLEIKTSLSTYKEKCQLSFFSLHPGKYIEIHIKDSGHGMKKEDIKNIFEPFYTTKPLGAGTGLGLSIAYEVIKEHNGHILVKSKEGEGSEFIIILPILDIDSISKDKRENKENIEYKGSGHILLVDDEIQIVKMCSIMLSKLGYKVTSFTQPEKALEAFNSSPNSYDVVITDVTMPNIAGDVLGKLLREIREDIPIILCSGYTDRINYEEAINSGFSEFISKPINTNYLVHVLENILSYKS